ncbi:PAS domain S-box protein [Tumebacillus flagellatus]|uniref:histidine kinase n=1 Tax=Tumebacillus flagellatus TaxID=1157490 RepID=A0A074M9P0_9BACL|nr:PAS domain S-box protein [Tumebacillus flagellatus]KEO82657.1 hypothetical protein EL26_13910 [Tumebacillus flagellatus]
MSEDLNNGKVLNTRMVPFRSLALYMIFWGVSVVLFHIITDWMLVERDATLSRLHLLSEIVFGMGSGLVAYGLLARNSVQIKQLKAALQESEDKFSEYVEDTTGARVLERKLTKRVVEESEQRYRSLFDTHPDMVFSCDLEGNFIEANAACVAVSGYTLEEALHHSFSQFLYPEDAPEVKYRFQRTIDEGEVQHYRCRIVHRDGHVILLDVTNIPIFVEDRVMGVYGIAKDITDEVHTREEFAETKELLESFFASTTDAIYLIDNQGIVCKVNEAFERIYGWSAEEIIGQNFSLLVPPGRQEEMRKLNEHLDCQEHLTDYETVRMRKDGSLFDVSITVSVIRDQNGQRVALAGIGRDITERKRVESALREIEYRYRLITEHTSDIIAIYDQDQIIQYVSPRVDQIFGYSADDYIGTNNFDHLHPDDFGEIMERLDSLYRTGESVRIVFRQRHADGHYVWLETMVMPVFDLHEQVIGLVVIARDNTERRRTEELLRKSDKLAVVGQLAAGVAHEIRNPLTSIKGFAQLMKNRLPEYNHYLDIMLSELDRIEFIMNEFLVLAKPQAVKFVKTDLQELLGDIVALLETQAIINNVQIITEYEDNLPNITCETNRLKQVFINVMKNAIEAMPDGGNLRIRTERAGADLVRVRVLDDGCGIHPERIPKLGEPFYTTKERGTGLGLMVSYKIIKDHQGDIRFKSRLGEGTTVEVELPIIQDSKNVLTVGDVG